MKRSALAVVLVVATVLNCVYADASLNTTTDVTDVQSSVDMQSVEDMVDAQEQVPAGLTLTSISEPLPQAKGLGGVSGRLPAIRTQFKYVCTGWRYPVWFWNLIGSKIFGKDCKFTRVYGAYVYCYPCF